MTENHRLSRAPVLEIDLRPVLRIDCVHRVFSLVVISSARRSGLMAVPIHPISPISGLGPALAERPRPALGTIPVIDFAPEGPRTLARDEVPGSLPDNPHVPARGRRRNPELILPLCLGWCDAAR